MFRSREAREKINPFLGRPKDARLRLSTTELESILAHEAGTTARPWTNRERVAWSVDTHLSAEAALAEEDVNIDATWLVARGVRREHLKSVGVPVILLKQRGFTIEKLREIGYDSTDLAAGEECVGGFVAAFGADEVLRLFLTCPRDAVMLAATPAQNALGLTPEKLLRACEGCQEEACMVLKQLGPQGLIGVQASTLLATGLDARLLAAAGHGILSVSQQVLGSPDEVAKLGFSLGL